MNGIHPDNVFRQGQRGDARTGTVYGQRTAKEYNRIKAAAKEKRTGKRVVFRHFARKLVNDDFIKEFVVINGPADPDMYVVSEAADGTPERWMRIEEDGAYVFFAPPGYTGGGIGWVYDRRFLARAESMVYESTKAVLDLGDISDRRIVETSPGDQAAERAPGEHSGHGLPRQRPDCTAEPQPAATAP